MQSLQNLWPHCSLTAVVLVNVSVHMSHIASPNESRNCILGDSAVATGNKPEHSESDVQKHVETIGGIKYQ